MPQNSLATLHRLPWTPGRWGVYSAPPDSVAAFGEGSGEGKWKRARGGKGMEGEGNEEGRENLTGEDGMEFRASVRHWLYGG